MNSKSARAWGRVLLLGIAWFALHPAGAQNLVKNPGFEQPLGPDNWTIVYAPVFGGTGNQPTNCGPNDFLFAGRSTVSHKDMGVPNTDTWDGHPYFWSKFGGHFAPNHTGKMHAYFRQVISGLTPAANYACSAWMAQRTANNNYLTKCNVYLETLGGPFLTTSKRTAYVTGNCHNNPAGWQRYTVTNSASLDGQIELRLHFNKFDAIGGRNNSYWEYRNMDAFFDNVTVVRAGQTNFMPPYDILKFERTNQDISLTWKTVMNNRYRIQVSTNFANPSSWSWVQWSPYWDTNLYATGTNITFSTNLVSLLLPTPAINPDAALFFRIYSESYVQ